MLRLIAKWGGVTLGCLLICGCSREKAEVQGGTAKPSAPPLTTKGPPPRIILDKTTFNFGTMDQEKTGKHVFEVRNEGEGELALRFVHTSCGCTSAKLGDLVWNPKDGAPPTQAVHVPPGGKIDLELAWDTEQRSGQFRTSAQLETSDPKQKVADFTVEGEIIPCLELSQTQVKIDDARNNEVSTAFLHVYSRTLDSFQITEVKSSNDKITAEFQPATETVLGAMNAKSGYKATIKIEPGLPIGRFSALLTFSTDIAERPQTQVSVVGQVTGDVLLTPEDHINFGTVKRGQGSTRIIFVKVRSDSPVEVKVGKVEPNFLKVNLKEFETGKNRYQLKVEVPPGAPGGQSKGVIELETTHATAKVVKIPVGVQVIQ